MSMDHDRRESETPTQQEGMMFAATPIWERNRKRRGLGGRKATPAAAEPTIAPEPRSFAAEPDDVEEPMALDRPVTDRTMATDYSRAEYADMGPSATATNSTLAAEDDAGLVAPIARTDRQPRSNGVGPAVIGAAAIAAVAIAAGGWFVTRDNGVPELAPGSTTSEMATAPLPVPATELPLSPPAEVAATPAPPAPVVTARAEPPRATVRAAPRVRPAAAAPSASSSGVNASTSAALPDGPQPYSALNPGTTPPPVNPSVNQAAPAPTEAPAEIPATPPTATPEPTPTPPSEDPTPPQATPPNA